MIIEKFELIDTAVSFAVATLTAVLAAAISVSRMATRLSGLARILIRPKAAFHFRKPWSKKNAVLDKQDVSGPREKASEAHSLGKSAREMAMLCDVCKTTVESSQRKGPHHATALDLKSAFLANCCICSAVYQEIQRLYGEIQEARTQVPFLNYTYVDDALEDELYGIRLVIQCKPLDEWQTMIYLLPGPKDPSNLMVDSATEGSESWNLNFYHISGNISSSTGDPSTLRIASDWLTTCRRQHHSCASLTHDSWYPKRLLDLTHDKPRLLLTELASPSGPYAALSHCWGPNPTFLTLSASNLSQFQRELPVAKMPKSFLDAIKIAKSLGLKYLWIDSLCILQSGEGSEEDWILHVADMSLVYANCTVNISIDRARNPDEGAFTHRDPLRIQRCDIWRQGIGSPKSPYTVTPLSTCGHAALKRLPLASRAWVVQERLLSPRVLHFGSEQIFWECSEVPLASESVPLGLPEQALTTDSRRPAHPRPFSMVQFQSQSQSSDNNPYAEVTDLTKVSFWHNIVREYSSCQLTKPYKDKLNAITAVARRVASRRGDEYLAGLFQTSIHFDLLWVRWEQLDEMPGKSTTKHSTGAYRAPTWSWACMDGPVHFFLKVESHMLLAKLVSTSVVLVNRNNKFGAVKDASLSWRGLLIPVYLTDSEPTLFDPRDNGLINNFFDRDEGAIVEHYDNNFRHGKDSFWLFPLVETAEPLQKHPDRVQENGLILIACPERLGYERIGCYYRDRLRPYNLLERGLQDVTFDLY